MSRHFVTRLRARCRAHGFTLVELMITIAVAAILAMIAVPSFHRLILSNRLTTAANAITNSINLARLDAIKLNATTQFCGNTTTTNTTDTLGGACGTQAGAVYSLPQSAATAGEVRAATPGIDAPIQIASSGVKAVRFSGQGFGYAPATPNTPYTGTVAVICTSQLASDNQRIVRMTGGSILATASSTGACP
ncbi:MAG TPA: GspH/FimT family pseudopilin [Rhodanobacteraceae bacterium]|nr:GspH/FimT family pseudopilin [Rhodanobacteraceae bacterium]